MLKNITFGAEEDLIRKARAKARREHTSLTATFRRWLKQYVGFDANSHDYDELMKTLSYAKPGRVFSRDEMNLS